MSEYRRRVLMPVHAEEVIAPCRRPLAAWLTTEREGKHYGVAVSRADGCHLTAEDYQWVRRRLGMREDDAVSFATREQEC